MPIERSDFATYQEEEELMCFCLYTCSEEQSHLITLKATYIYIYVYNELHIYLQSNLNKAGTVVFLTTFNSKLPFNVSLTKVTKTPPSEGILLRTIVHSLLQHGFQLEHSRSVTASR